MRRTTYSNDKTDSPEMESSYKLEYSIEKDRILKVLGQTLANLEVALCLPLILKNEAIMNNHFLEDEQLLLHKAFMSYLHLPDPHKSKRKHESIECEMKKGINYLRERIINEQTDEGMMAVGESARKGTSKGIVKMHKDVFRAIDVLTSKLKLKKFVKEFLLGKISPAASIFLSYMKQLQSCAEMRLAITHDMELANDENLYLVWGRNIKSKTDIEKLKKELEAQRAEGSAQLVEKMAIINKNQCLIEKLKQHCKEDIKKRVNESERSMIYEWRGSENRQESLRADIAELERKYQQLLNEHIVNEKDMKAKKIKVESQLVSVLARYDNDIGERQDELEELTDGFNEEKRQMADLQAKFEIQDVEYYSLMNEKETEEREEFMLRLYNFKANRAARLFQRAWRAYWKGRSRGGKGKKGKKGKK